ncbi:hypothetical protein LBCZ_2431 [Lacticaseibacillus casei DSM 20011 = JCM 1134 = ATCC 393]|uniref:Uncharacterized protein n=1 Tax=Lacticaseibacillus casei DSM 20011 = JCM 1134 = ATCC 393 TaxID=1423732 RepID=A0AAD1AR85_LACCA|nr:hypothetical protein LBCZ_2431 [Lacticaseibacillus casei DSM 20011 = JCM 1134 = ATCC 393]
MAKAWPFEFSGHEFSAASRKRAHRRRNLRVRTLGAMAKTAITPKATYTPVSERASSRSVENML